MLLNATLNADYKPGSNRSEELACADWRFLLPSMKLERVLCLGLPKYEILKVLSLVSKKIYIVHTDNCTCKSTKKFKSMDLVIVQRYEDIDFKEKSVSLILLATSKEVSRIFEDKEHFLELFRILVPEGSVYFEYKGIGTIYKFTKKYERMVKNDTTRFYHKFLLTPTSGELQTAVPVDENHIAHFFFKNVLFGQSIKKRILSVVGRTLSQIGFIGYTIQRRAVLIQNSPANYHKNLLPQFLRKLAKKSGINIDQYRYGLSARGRYNSNKIIYYLFDRYSRSADIIIKMTRVPYFNCRLEHEYQMLSAVLKNNLVTSDTFPTPLFLGYHSGLAILGQKAMKGRPFRTLTSATSDCPFAADAIEWITTLGKNSRKTTLASTEEVSKILLKLFNIFTDIYKISTRHKKFLKRQITKISFSRKPFPVVFCHGDAGNWNIVISKEGKAQFLDWEAAEPAGMPLWDIFYFFEGFCNWIARKQHGSFDMIKNFQNYFLQSSDISLFLKKVCNRYCDEVGVDKSLLASMFYTCWMHRALRQATWADSLEQAHFVNILRLSIDYFNSPGISFLFAK